jgi:hypothetical protein
MGGTANDLHVLIFAHQTVPDNGRDVLSLELEVLELRFCESGSMTPISMPFVIVMSLTKSSPASKAVAILCNRSPTIPKR